MAAEVAAMAEGEALCDLSLASGKILLPLGLGLVVIVSEAERLCCAILMDWLFLFNFYLSTDLTRQVISFNSPIPSLAH